MWVNIILYSRKLKTHRTQKMDLGRNVTDYIHQLKSNGLANMNKKLLLQSWFMLISEFTILLF